MSNPKITTDLKKLRHNLDVLSKKITNDGMSVMGVTKVFCAHPEIVKEYEECEGITYLADSRIENFYNYPEDSEKLRVLLRLPMLSEVDEVVEAVDISLNSELKTIRNLNKAAESLNKKHQIILMVDLGDLREGIFYQEELMKTVKEIMTLNNIYLLGLGVNLTCYGAVIPDYDVLKQLEDYKELLEGEFDLSLEVISGGNSSSLHLIDDPESEIPKGINNLRIGEAFVLGGETAYDNKLENMHQDVFSLTAEIIEFKNKPSYPIGNLGVNAFGEKPDIEDKGDMDRGIIAIGRQDVRFEDLTPVDSNIEIIGGSSDHTIIDFTKAEKDYQVGDEVVFHVNYGALLSSFTSPYVKKEFKK